MRKAEVLKIQKASGTIRNRFRVSLNQWRKWSIRARRVFNDLFEVMSRNQYLFLHPEMPKISKQRWRTVAWNASWMAANAVDGRA